jgi:hypothetical protein
MNHIPILDRDDGSRIVNRVLACYSVPAYVRRAREVEEAFEQLLSASARQREEWLKAIRSRLSLLCPESNDWNAFFVFDASEHQIVSLRNLCATLGVTSPPPGPCRTARSYRRQLQELRTCIEQFNKRWLNYLCTLDLTRINDLRDGYNRYYLLEKECAMRSARLARQHFRTLEPITRQELLLRFPLLPIPPSAGRVKRQR